MYKGQAVAVVVPAYNEEQHIVATLQDMPAFVDSVIVVDDGSTDATVERVSAFSAQEKRVSLLLNEGNQGKGTAVVRGCREAISTGAAIVALMNAPDAVAASRKELDRDATNALQSLYAKNLAARRLGEKARAVPACRRASRYSATRSSS